MIQKQIVKIKNPNSGLLNINDEVRYARSKQAKEVKEKVIRIPIPKELQPKRVKPKLSPEEKQYEKEAKEFRKWRREEDKKEKQIAKNTKIACDRELAVLQYMLSTGVLYYHHGTKDPETATIQDKIDSVKNENKHVEYHPYIWNHQGEGENYMPKCQLGYLWSSLEFDTIYDVPLDGTWIFHAYDSGQRGLGVFHYLTATKIEEEVDVPYVDPGGFPQITV